MRGWEGERGREMKERERDERENRVTPKANISQIKSFKISSSYVNKQKLKENLKLKQ